MRISLLIGIICFLFSLHTINTVGQSEAKKQDGIQFLHGEWDEAKRLAKEQNKYIVADVYAFWCGPCKKMTRETFTDKRVGDFYNKNYISYKIDLAQEENKVMNSVFNVRAFPTIIYYNPDGEEVHRFQGFAPPETFLKHGRKAIFDKEKLKEYEQKFKKGKKDPKFLAEYIQYMNFGDIYNAEVVEKYLKKQSDKDLTNETNTQLIYDTADDLYSPFFEILVENKAHFEETFGKDAVNLRMRNIAIENFRKATKSNDEERFLKSVEVAKILDMPQKDLLAFQMELEFYDQTNKWDKFADACVAFLDSNQEEINPNLLNSIAWKFYENIEDKKLLAKAESWSRQSIAKRSEYHNNDTLAALLFKQGKFEEGQKAAENAIKIAKQTKQKYDNTEKLIEKYKK